MKPLENSGGGHFAALPQEDKTDLDGRNIRLGTVRLDSLVAVGVLSSQNYVAGSAGWSINGDGNAEFNNVVIRGDLESSNYVPTTAATPGTGWKLFQNGDVQVDNAVMSSLTLESEPMQIKLGTTVLQFKPYDDASTTLYSGGGGIHFPGGIFAKKEFGVDTSIMEIAGPDQGSSGSWASLSFHSDYNAGSPQTQTYLGTRFGGGELYLGTPGDTVYLRGSTIRLGEAGDTITLGLDANDLLNITASGGDYSILNDQQNNGLKIYDGTGGVAVTYNGTEMAVFDADGLTLDTGSDLAVGTGIVRLGTTNANDYVQMSEANNWVRFVIDGSEAWRVTHSTATHMDLYGASGSYVRNAEGGNFHIDNEVPNTDIYIRTDNGGGVKNRIFIDGSANRTQIHTHDGTEWYRFDHTTTTNTGLAGWRHNHYTGGPPYEFWPLVSSARFKDEVQDPVAEDLEHFENVVRNIRIRKWKEKPQYLMNEGAIKKDEDGKPILAKPTPTHDIFGVVAEEVVELQPELVGTDDDGNPYSYDPANALSIPMLHVMKKVLSTLDDMQTRLEALEA